ncbi:hypothetical protein Tco_0543757 [Tanacetum coccineum]
MKELNCFTWIVGPMRVTKHKWEEIYSVIVDDYSIYTWTLFYDPRMKLRSSQRLSHDDSSAIIQAQVNSVRTDRGTGVLKLKTQLQAYFKEEGI